MIYVADQTATCVGIAVQECLLVREHQDEPWTYWYDGITGFRHEAGTNYILHILEEEIAHPLQDASSIRWELIEVLKTW